MTAAFIIKKLVTALLLPPGIFIVALLVTALFAKNKLRIWLFILAGLLYAVSIEPTARLFMMPLEDAYKLPTMTQVGQCDAYVVLGAGVIDNAPDITGPGALSEQALARVMAAYRLYRVHRKPIIFSGGKIFNKPAESDIAVKTFLSLGVQRGRIIKEDRSVDTAENARFVKEVADRQGIKKIVLITSAYHMKRSCMLFNRYFKDTEIVAYPAHYETSRGNYSLLSWLPDGDRLAISGMALKEYLGIAFYKVKSQ